VKHCFERETIEETKNPPGVAGLSVACGNGAESGLLCRFALFLAFYRPGEVITHQGNPHTDKTPRKAICDAIGNKPADELGLAIRKRAKLIHARRGRHLVKCGGCDFALSGKKRGNPRGAFDGDPAGMFGGFVFHGVSVVCK
jgi:hypothetical protein